MRLGPNHAPGSRRGAGHPRKISTTSEGDSESFHARRVWLGQVPKMQTLYVWRTAVLLPQVIVLSLAPQACDSADESAQRPSEIEEAGACWQPPDRTCGVAGGMVTRACRADRSLCCEFSSTCVPCGWSKCNRAGQGDCTPSDSQQCQILAGAVE